MVSCVYLYESSHHKVIAHYPSINLALKSSNVVTPFVLIHKSGVTRELYDCVSITIQSGISITDIERLLINLHKGHHTPIRQGSGTPYFEINKRFPWSKANNSDICEIILGD